MHWGACDSDMRMATEFEAVGIARAIHSVRATVTCSQQPSHSFSRRFSRRLSLSVLSLLAVHLPVSLIVVGCVGDRRTLLPVQQSSHSHTQPAGVHRLRQCVSPTRVVRCHSLMGEGTMKEPCFSAQKTVCALGRPAPPPAHSTCYHGMGTHCAGVCQTPAFARRRAERRCTRVCFS